MNHDWPLIFLAALLIVVLAGLAYWLAVDVRVP